MDEKRRQAARNRRRMQLDESSSDGDNDSHPYSDAASNFNQSQSTAFNEPSLQSNRTAHHTLDFNKVNRNAEQMSKASAAGKGPGAPEDIMSLMSGGAAGSLEQQIRMQIELREGSKFQEGYPEAASQRSTVKEEAKGAPGKLKKSAAVKLDG